MPEKESTAKKEVSWNNTDADDEPSVGYDNPECVIPNNQDLLSLIVFSRCLPNEMPSNEDGYREDVHQTLTTDPTLYTPPSDTPSSDGPGCVFESHTRVPSQDDLRWSPSPGPSNTCSSDNGGAAASKLSGDAIDDEDTVFKAEQLKLPSPLNVPQTCVFFNGMCLLSTSS
jgi:hypothetical protein